MYSISKYFCYKKLTGCAVIFKIFQKQQNDYACKISKDSKQWKMVELKNKQANKKLILVTQLLSVWLMCCKSKMIRENRRWLLLKQVLGGSDDQVHCFTLGC